MAHSLPARSLSLLIQAACLVAYVFSLTLPALVFDKPFPKDQSGLDVLMMGWAGLIVLDPRWLANVCFGWCVFVNLGNGRSRVMSTIGLLLVAGSLILPIHYFPSDQSFRVDVLGTGAWLWAFSLTITFAMALLGGSHSQVAPADGSRIGGWGGTALAAAALIGSVVLFYPRLFPAQSRFAELCKNAEVRVDIPVSNVTSVFIEDDWFATDGPSIRPTGAPVGEALIYNTDIQFVERKARPSFHFPHPENYQRLSMQPGPGRTPHPGNSKIYVETIAAPTADYVIRATDLSEPDVAEGLGGSRIEIFETHGAKRRIAHAQHYWNYPPRAVCPAEPEGKFSEINFLTRALGLKLVRR